MKFTFTLLFLTTFFLVSAQVSTTEGGLLGGQLFSKEITESRVKEFIVSELLELPNKKLLEVEIDGLTASASGELTTVIYSCKELNKKAMIFGFWNLYVNEFNVRYKGYAFKHFDFGTANELVNSLDEVLDEKKSIIKLKDNQGLSTNAVYKFDDVTFIFYKNELGSNLIRVLWNGFDSEWNQANVKAMSRRMKRFFEDK